MASKKKLKKKIKRLKYHIELISHNYAIDVRGLADKVECCSDGGTCLGK